ncbi:hypothetical protein NL676_000005 [Syzygium grande]|nr:hypothetical protein NL676_000005 [Syzygium grande]
MRFRPTEEEREKRERAEKRTPATAQWSGLDEADGRWRPNESRPGDELAGSYCRRQGGDLERDSAVQKQRRDTTPSRRK